MKRFWLCLLLLLAAANVEAAELLIFTADWCSACQQLKKDVDANPETFSNYLWGYIDFDEEPYLVKTYNVRTVPTFLILDDNKVVKSMTGYPGLEKLKNWLQKSR